jgi:hypothetical protein
MKKLFLGIVCLFCLMCTGTSYAGPKWELGEDSWMKLSFLGQAHFANLNNAPNESDFYLRRGRFILAGQIMDGVKFFVETDNDNAGKHGVDASTDIQDAFIDVRIADTDHWVMGGLVLLPFSMETYSSAASLLGIDYNSEVIKLTNTFVWRDYGVSFHGNFNKKVAYRAGFFDGYDSTTGTKNPDAAIRFTGHVAYGVFGEVETGWFYTQDKQAKKGNYLTVGAGFDNQSDATQIGVSEIDSTAWVVDFQSGFGLGDTDFGPADLTINGAFYGWDNAAFDGTTAFVEGGLRVSKAMGTLKFSNQKQDGADRVTDITFGAHYFMKGHNVRGGIEFRTGDSEDLILAGVQFLL